MDVVEKDPHTGCGIPRSALQFAVLDTEGHIYAVLPGPALAVFVRDALRVKLDNAELDIYRIGTFEEHDEKFGGPTQGDA